MTIQVGDKVPSVNFKTLADGGPKEVSSDEVFGGKKRFYKKLSTFSNPN